MTPALFHIGLHKTGTTSFQRALRLAQPTLLNYGVLYPAPPKNGSFNDQHADVPQMLRKGRTSEVRDYFQQVSAEACSISDRHIRLIMFSSEEFSNLCYDKKAMVHFKGITNECFGDVTLIAVIRSLVDYCASGLRQEIDGAALAPAQLGSDTVVLNHLLSVARKIRLLESELGPIRIIDYEEASVSGDLNNFLARECFGADAPMLENLKLNVGTDRDKVLVGLLLSQLRSLLAFLKKSHPYAQDVQTALAELIDLNHVKNIVRPAKATEFAAFFEASVRAIVRSTFDANRSAVVNEVSTLPKMCQEILLRGL